MSEVIQGNGFNAGMFLDVIAKHLQDDDTAYEDPQEASEQARRIWVALRNAGWAIEHTASMHAREDAAAARIAALETENAQHINAIECLRQERDGRDTTIAALIKDREELTLALKWCKPRLKHENYIKHIEWTLSKYPNPPPPNEPRIVRSEDERGDWCPSDPRGPGYSRGDRAAPRREATAPPAVTPAPE